MKIISVVCIAMPSGDTLWFESKLMPEYGSKVVSAWKEQNPEYIDTDCTMGMIEIRMPEEKFKKIMTTNSFDWPKTI